MDKRLIKLAKISPPSYAKIIKKRNLSLLKRLEKNRKKLELYEFDEFEFGGECSGEDTGEDTGEDRTTQIGCPHCLVDCYDCLWTKAFKSNPYDDIKKGQICIQIPFNGVLYKNTWIVYSEDMEYLTNYCRSKKLYENTKKFLEGHIEWSELKCWGEIWNKR